MDPFTLFALASGAVEAVKKGCALYKEIKGVAGEVKGIFKDLDEQFNKKYEGKKPPPEAVKQLNDEKKRIKELSEKKPDDIYIEIGDQLGVYYENYAKCVALFEAEELKAKTEVYEGDTSLGKRALQRVLMKSKLEAMGVELREIMIYHSPPELGDLYTRVNDMMHTMMEEQKVAIAKQAHLNAVAAKKRKKQMDLYFMRGVIVLCFVIIMLFFSIFMFALVQDRIEKYPHLGTDWVPRDINRPVPKYTYIGR